ncbi:MAG: ATP-dependent 6-phosphofructokinase [Capsulimonadaceae bacterium]
MNRIGVLTSGGDAPGMNAAIRAVVRTAVTAGAEVYGIHRGYAGLIDGDLRPMTARDVGGIMELGGTVLDSARSSVFRTDAGVESALQTLRAHDIEGLIVIGGNGSQAGAMALLDRGVQVNGVASTIDNDLAGSDITIGVDTALNIALEAIDRLRTTASSHHRLFLVEVMGRDCGYLALASGIAGGAEVVVMPERDICPEEVLVRVQDAKKRGKRHAMIVVAEGAALGVTALYKYLSEDAGTLFDPRVTILGHVQRGGRPTAYDRILATRLGAAATELLLRGQSGNLIGQMHGITTHTPLHDVVNRKKPLPMELLRLVDILKI